jgi:hypothetical protein
MKFPLAMLVAAALLPAANWANASAQPDPADPGVSVPTLKYESVFSHYLPFQESSLVNWLDTRNESKPEGMDDMDVPARPNTKPQGNGHSNHNMQNR